MNIEKIMILSDMDGTLLTTKKEISGRDMAAIRRFRELGGRFTVATGRTIQAFGQYTKLLELSDPVIMYNGAAIHDYIRDETLFTHPLETMCREYVRDILSDMPDIGGEVLRTDGTYVFLNNDYQKLHTKICGISPIYRSLDDIESGGWLKVLFAMSPEDMDFFGALVRRKNYEGVSFVRSSEMFWEMLPEGVSKGSALQKYRTLDGMDGFTFVAIGDFDNDLEMIRSADIGVCPSNAEDSVKAAADIVLTRSNDEGAVEELIELLIDRCNN